MHETRKWSSATRRITVESWITQVLKYRRQPVQCVAYCEMMMMMIIIITTTIIIIIIIIIIEAAGTISVIQKIREQHTRKT